VLVLASALACLFCAAAAYYGALTARLALLVFAYLLAPAICIAIRGTNGRAGALDLAAILLLWLPLEAGLGENQVPRPVQGSLHAAAYAVAITLALIVFVIYRRFEGMKYNAPRRISDLGIAAAGFVCAAGVLIPVGLAVGFLGPAHTPTAGAPTLLARTGFIFAATALPEEILFRSLIQNWLMQRFGPGHGVVALAAVIFGLAHLNNGPGAAPNWPYAIVASLAGFIFGTVFRRSSTILSSALVHTGVNTVKYLFF
jgi:membrane protease YdiL (CAAX protease family)